MDNKITKRRFSDFLSYEWIFIIIVALVAIFVWEIIFSVAGVRLTKGQQFKIIYDQYVDTAYDDDIVEIAYNYGAFSYDVQKIGKEGMGTNSEIDELDTRYKTQDADVIITSCAEQSTDVSFYRRANSIIEVFEVWSFNEAVKYGDEYLSKLLKGDQLKISSGSLDASYKFEQIDLNKVDEMFVERQDGDNRFRKNEEIENGKLLERARIETLCKEIVFAKRMLKNHPEIFHMYTKGQQFYDQAVARGDQASIQAREKTLIENRQKNLDAYGTETLAYGVRTDVLKGGKYSSANLFTMEGKPEELVIMAFDFTAYQPHLQFESLVFINSVIRACTGYLLEV